MAQTRQLRSWTLVPDPNLYENLLIPFPVFGCFLQSRKHSFDNLTCLFGLVTIRLSRSLRVLPVLKRVLLKRIVSCGPGRPIRRRDCVLYIFLFLGISIQCVCRCMLTIMYMWMPQENFQQSVLTIYLPEAGSLLSLIRLQAD